MMSRPVKIGVVGVGTVSLRGVIPHLVQEDMKDRVVVTALCDPVEARARAAAERFGIPAVFSDYDEMLRNGDIDAVTIATPIGIHYEQGKAALEAGKHIHFNKTMTVTTAEATELIELAERQNLKIVASPGEMLRPHNQEIRRRIQAGELGTIAWAICGAAFENYHEDEPERSGQDGVPPIDPTWYFRKPGGGPLYDMSVYALHGLTGILGPARRVTALSGIRITDRSFAGQMLPIEADDNTIMLLDFGDNLFAVLYGTAAGGLRDSLDFSGAYFGTKGTIQGLQLNGAPFDYPGRDIAITAEDEGLRPGFGGNEWILPNIEGVHRHIPEQHVFADVMQLVDWIREDKPSVATAEHARHVIEIIEEAYASAATGVARTLSTTF